MFISNFGAVGWPNKAPQTASQSDPEEVIFLLFGELGSISDVVSRFSELLVWMMMLS